MAEEYIEQPQQPLDLKKYTGLLLRRRWYILVPMFAVWLMAWTVSWVLPSVYRSSTLILVQQPTVSVSPTSISSNAANDLQGRLVSIEQQIRSRTRLLSIIQDLNLYPKQRARHMSDDDLVARMNKDLNITLERAPGREELSSFTITFDADDPMQAQAATNKLTNIVIHENLQLTQATAAHTVQFLDDQLEDARKKLLAQDERVRMFKDHYSGELPTQTTSNVQILGGLQSQLQQAQNELARAKERNTYLESMMNQLKSTSPTGSGSTKSGGGGSPALVALDTQLEQLKNKLSELNSRYTEQHPDVRKVKEQIAKTEKARQQMIADIKANPDAAGGSDAPVDYNGNKTLSPAMEAASQLKANQVEIANKERLIDSLRGQIGMYEGRLNSAPAREQELLDLTRDYDQSKKYYDELLAQKNQAGLAANLGKSQEGLQFVIQDAPSLPSKPFSPKRFLICLGGLAAGLALGIVLALGSEFLDDRVYDENDFKKLVPVDIMAEIPPLPTAVEEQARRKRFWLEWVASGALGMVMLMGVAYSFLRG